MSDDICDLPTIGVIAQRTGYPIHRVKYVIRARGIRPVARAGIARVFAESDVDRITAELRRIDAGKGGRNGP